MARPTFHVSRAFACLLAAGLVSVSAAHAEEVVVTVKADAPGKKISTDLSGIYFEDSNYAADGGLYAELIQNRSFECSTGDRKDWNPLTSWDLVERDGGGGPPTVRLESKDGEVLAEAAWKKHSVTLRANNSAKDAGIAVTTKAQSRFRGSPRACAARTPATTSRVRRRDNHSSR